MPMPEGFYEGACVANANQLTELTVVIEKLIFITAPKVECDYVFHLAGLEYKLHKQNYTSDKLNKIIELKCENQNLSYADAEKRAEKALKAKSAQLALEGRRIVNAMKRIEEPCATPEDIAKAEELMKNLYRKLSPLLIKQKGNELRLLKKAIRAFRQVDIKTLALLDSATEEPTPIYEENYQSYAGLYSAKIKEAMQRMAQIRNSYPFNKAEVMMDKKKLEERQNEIRNQIKQAQNYNCNLEKTVNSLFPKE